MIRPASFRMNEETAVNNYFQSETQLDPRMVVGAAQREFDEFVALLRANGVNVIVVEDIKENDTPDALFPNNWISMHKEGKVGLYPMFAENRRRERREDILEVLEENGFEISEVIDYSSAEEEEVFLEGTGSLILDRENSIAYCALSDRADEELLIEFCEDFEYTPIIFGAYQTSDNRRLPIYHTNVMMCVADQFAVICLDSIDDKKHRKAVKEQLKSNGKTVVAITEKQMHEFAGNMLRFEIMDQGVGSRLRFSMEIGTENNLTIGFAEASENPVAVINGRRKQIRTNMQRTCDAIKAAVEAAD